MGVRVCIRQGFCEFGVLADLSCLGVGFPNFSDFGVLILFLFVRGLNLAFLGIFGICGFGVIFVDLLGFASRLWCLGLV